MMSRKFPSRLQVGLKNFVSPQTSLKNFAAPQTRLKNLVAPQMGLKNFVARQTGLKNFVAPQIRSLDGSDMSTPPGPIYDIKQRFLVMHFLLRSFPKKGFCIEALPVK